MPTVSIQALLSRATAGDANSQHQLGLLYLRGEGVAQSVTAAADWFAQAAEAGHSESQFILGALYQQGKDLPCDAAKAVEWYRRAAEQGHAAAQFNLGYCFEIGDGVDKNIGEAITWYRQAAEQGDADARLALDELLRPEIEPTKAETAENDSERSEPLVAVLAAQDQADPLPGFAEAPAPPTAATAVNVPLPIASRPTPIVDAQARLAQLYAEGLGVAQDYAEAAKWYRRAGEQAHLESQFQLGLCYEYAKGVSQDFIEAYKWYNLSVALGFKNAQKSRDRILGQMTADQIAESQQQASALYRPLRQKLALKMAAPPPIKSILQRHAAAAPKL